TLHVDADERLLSFAVKYSAESQQPATLEFLNGNLESLKLEPSTFDIAFCGEVLEHINDVQKFLKQVFLILKPGGRLVLTTPNDNAFAYVLLRSLPLETRGRLFRRFSAKLHLHAGVL